MIYEFEAVLLALDPALHTSGAALLVPDYGPMDGPPRPFSGEYILHEFGRVETQNERERYINTLLELAEELKLPPVIVAETWDPPRNRHTRNPANGEVEYVPDQKWSFKTVLGIGEGWGRWSAEIETANEYRREEGLGPDIVLERVLPNEWRDVVFGTRRPRDSASLKAVAQRYFEGVFGYQAIADVAEAACIGLYGLRSKTVFDAVSHYELPSTKKRRSKRAS